jgi:hypothetical protein
MRQLWEMAKVPTAINPVILIPIIRYCELNTTVGSADTKSAYLPIVAEVIFCPEAIQFLGRRVQVANAEDA